MINFKIKELKYLTKIVNYKLKIPGRSGQAGFTLIEVLVVMAIVAFLAGIGIFMSGDMYRSTSFQSDSGALAVALQRARSRAINNINEMPHGVKILDGDYIIFEGPDYLSSPATYEVISGNSGFTFTGPDEVVFEQLSGNCSLCDDITISDGAKTVTIILNTEGRIDF